MASKLGNREEADADLANEASAPWAEAWIVLICYSESDPCLCAFWASADMIDQVCQRLDRQPAAVIATLMVLKRGASVWIYTFSASAS